MQKWIGMLKWLEERRNRGYLYKNSRSEMVLYLNLSLIPWGLRSLFDGGIEGELWRLLQLRMVR